MHRALCFSFAIALVTTSLGCSKSKDQETPEIDNRGPEIGNLEIVTTPPSVTFTFTVEPSKAGVSQGKSECWVSRGTGSLADIKKGRRNPTPDAPNALFNAATRPNELQRVSVGGEWSAPNGWMGRVKLSPSAKVKGWTFQVDNIDRNWPNNCVVTSIILLDDRGNASNQLTFWIDFANGRVLEGGALAKLLVGKWANDSQNSVTTFKNDGTCIFQGGMDLNEKGTWKVADGTLETKFENPNSALDWTRGAKIFAINDMTFKADQGPDYGPTNLREWKRVKE